MWFQICKPGAPCCPNFGPHSTPLRWDHLAPTPEQWRLWHVHTAPGDIPTHTFHKLLLAPADRDFSLRAGWTLLYSGQRTRDDRTSLDSAVFATPSSRLHTTTFPTRRPAARSTDTSACSCRGSTRPSRALPTPSRRARPAPRPRRQRQCQRLRHRTRCRRRLWGRARRLPRAQRRSPRRACGRTSWRAAVSSGGCFVARRTASSGRRWRSGSQWHPACNTRWSCTAPSSRGSAEGGGARTRPLQMHRVRLRVDVPQGSLRPRPALPVGHGLHRARSAAAYLFARDPPRPVHGEGRRAARIVLVGRARQARAARGGARGRGRAVGRTGRYGQR